MKFGKTFVNDKGDKLVGQQTVDGVEVYFNKDGVQAKGIFTKAATKKPTPMWATESAPLAI